MTPNKKLKSRRGITLVEVLTVVALMTIMLGLAMPNLLAESQRIEMTALDGYARSVAVAAQSRLYGMKNAGTAADSEYAMLNDNNASKETEITIGEEQKAVRYVCNFGDTKTGGNMLLSGAITDLELLEKGKIVVVYDPETADILYVFYSEREFSVAGLFPTVNESFLTDNRIGVYRGEGAPAPERIIGLPQFAVGWGDDDEKYLELTMRGNPASELLDKHLGLEVYALVPAADSAEYDPLLIYTEGLVATPYTAESVVETGSASRTIKAEAGAPLTLRKIKDNGGKLRFAIDSMVIATADYDNNDVKKMLYRQNYPDYVSMAEETLCPRESLGNWLDKKFNPYISFGMDAGLYTISENLQTKLNKTDAKVTDFVFPNQKMELRVKLYVLKENGGKYETQTIKGAFDGRYVEDPDYASVTVTSQPANPYFYSSSSRDESEIALASVRDLQNLKYIFETENKIERAKLYHDIDTQQFYNKLTLVRYALIDKDPSVKGQWASYANADTLQVAQITYADGKGNGRKGFTISGKKSSGGRYAIKNVQAGGAGWQRGGFIEYAKNITVEDLDIVNPKIWKIGYRANFIETNDEGKITGIKVEWDNSVSGGLFGVAENCTFTNVHCYNDLAQDFKQEPFEAESYDPEKWVPSVMAARYISGSVAGGLVGIAVGTNSQTTTFTNCSASTQINSYYYGAMAQCVYAGGLVGIAMGNVKIENSYAACQLSGYYSGGLVGAVAESPFTCRAYIIRPGHWFNDEWIGDQYEADYNSPLTGTLTIENSFSAGHIQRQTMVGGGLIAQTNDVEVTVENCYSATTWEILPPIAYGTFEGDTGNCYLVQNEINVPITLNTEAHFKRTAGDVLSLNSGVKCGNAVTVEELKNEFTSNTNWVEKASRTLQWYNKGNSGAPTFFLPTDAEPGSEGDISEAYPFPMPSDNTEFRGDWNKDNVTNIDGTFDTTFDGFYCVYFKRSDDGYQRFIDASAVHELGFDFSGTDITLLGLGNVIKNSVTEPQNIWWASKENAGGGYVTAFGTGVAGMTNVTVSDTTVTFTGAPYYNSTYRPTKGYVSIDKFSGDPGDGKSRCLNWDYYGWYVSGGLIRIGYLAQSEDDSKVAFGTDFSVPVADFQEAIGYGDFVFDTGNAELVYGDGYFHVQRK